MDMGEISLGLFGLVLALCLWRYLKREKEGRGRCAFFQEFVVWILRCLRTRLHLSVTGKRLEELQKIYVGKGEEEIYYAFYGKWGCIMLGVLLGGLLLVAGSGLIAEKRELLENYFIEREGVKGKEKQVRLNVSAREEEREVTLTIPARIYTEEELAEEFDKAEEYIREVYLGENPSSEEISRPLCLMDRIPQSILTVEWECGKEGVIDQDGTIHNEELEESQASSVTAIVSCHTGRGEEEKERRIVFQVTVLPKDKSQEDTFWESWQENMQKNEEASAAMEYVELPRAVEGVSIQYGEEVASLPPVVCCGMLIGLISIPLLSGGRIKSALEKREEQLVFSYPEFVEHFVLLIGAGQTVRGAWEKIAEEYQRKNGRLQYVYEEMLVSLREMENGMSEARAYELFGRRTGILSYMKFCTLLVQNLKKGSADLLELLNYEVEDAFRERKENAKAMGEKAGTKLLMPMMLMLIIVFAIIIYAAFSGM